jgi:hypothetical protein
VTPHRLPDSEFHAVSSRQFRYASPNAERLLSIRIARVLKPLRARHRHR